MLVPLDFNPGFIKDTTDYAATGFWVDGNLVRFRGKYPESWGGWTRYNSTQFEGKARVLYKFTTLTGEIFLAVGTSRYFYVDQGGALIEVTPLRDSVTGLTDPIDTTDTSSIVVVNDVAHGANIDDYILISGADAVGGIPAAAINTYHQILTTPDLDSYTIDTGTAATSSVTGGGTVDVNYILKFGTESQIAGVGWGAGPWGTARDVGWGDPTDLSNAAGGGSAALWSVSSYNAEDLIISPRGGEIYYWDATNPGDRALPLSSFGGAANTPEMVTKMLVSSFDSHVIAFGVNPLGESVLDPMLIRWSDQEDPALWTVNSTTSAGFKRLSVGSKIVAAVQSGDDILVFTDKAIYGMTYIGGNDIFAFTQVAEGVDIAGPNSIILFRDNVYWMGKGGFYQFTGNVTQINDAIDISEIPCPIQEYIIDDADWSNSEKFYAGTNSAFNEIIWFYTSKTSTNAQNDKYVVFNNLQNVWYYGSLARTAWLDSSYSVGPIAAGDDGYLYNQEDGADDYSSGSAVPLEPYILSAPFTMNDGNSLMMASRIIHDVEFRGDGPTAQTAVIELRTKDYPGEQNQDTSTNSVTRTAILPVQAFTKQSHIRIRGRQMSFKISSSTLGTKWRLGQPRVDIRPDGRQ